MNHKEFSGQVSVVVTSIAHPTQAMREIAAQCVARGFSFIVMGDVPSPKDFTLEGCDFYGIERQKELPFKLSSCLPTRHYSRKNLGYLLAVHSGAKYILESDDDNMPLESFWAARSLSNRGKVIRNPGWANVYSYFTDSPIWPRGLPLDSVRRPQPAFDSLEEAEVRCPIQQGLSGGDPDVDAIYRLVMQQPVAFKENRSIALGKGTWSPFNSQCTAWFPVAYPLLYLPSYCPFRMTDIWRSFVAQRIAWENEWSLVFRSPETFQDRNDHDLMKDFADETSGYLMNKKIGQQLESLKLEPGEENLGANLIRCYEELVRLEVVGADEINLVKAWVEDCQLYL